MALETRLHRCRCREVAVIANSISKCWAALRQRQVCPYNDIGQPDVWIKMA